MAVCAWEALGPQDDPWTGTNCTTKHNFRRTSALALSERCTAGLCEGSDASSPQHERAQAG